MSDLFSSSFIVGWWTLCFICALFGNELTRKLATTLLWFVGLAMLAAPILGLGVFSP